MRLDLSSDAKAVNIFLLQKHKEMWLDLVFFSWKTSGFGLSLYQSSETPWTLDNVENLPVVQNTATAAGGFS